MLRKINKLDDYVLVNGKKFRKGYTTGSCAAAASKAAVMMLFTGIIVETVSIDTPAGIRLSLPVSDVICISECCVSCSIVKDGGDDPDITTGLKIFAKAERKAKSGIEIATAEGIGIVTLPGLKVEVGKPAINPVPMKMILKEVSEVLPEGEGVLITLSIPKGEETTLKTYNPKLGIIGGISILGTSGIVNPMSEEAWKEALVAELSVISAKRKKNIVYVFGNYGENFVKNSLGLTIDNVIKISNFVGFMLEQAVEYGIESILIVGHIGKLVKVAAGIFQTHSKIADARMEIMTAYSALEGASNDIVSQIYKCRTTEAAIDIIERNQLRGVYGRIVSNVSKHCTDYVFGKIKIGCVLFHGDAEILAMEANAKEILNYLN